MKNLKNYTAFPKIIAFMCCTALVVTSCSRGDHHDHTPKVKVTTFASGLAGPMGIEADDQGNVWVTESGSAIPDEEGNTYNNNGKVLVITPQGQKYDAIINLESFANVHSGELQGTAHILLHGGTLYVLSGNRLYLADVSNFEPGDAPIDASMLPSEDIAAVISQIPSENNPDHDSHPYNFTKGPGGDLYLVDAGANAVIHRVGANNYEVVAEIPAIPNPFFPGLGGPTVQSVPTAILFEGNNFLVTTLTGFPFPAGEASIYKVSLSGEVSVFDTGFTMLTDLVEGRSTNHLAAQYAASFNPATGFEINSGSLVWTDGSETSILTENLNQPVGIKQVNHFTWYVTSLGDGTVLKVTYR